MSATPVKIRLANAIRPEISPVEIRAIFNSDQPFLLLPEYLVERLGLDTICSRLVTEEDGNRVRCPYVGPLHVQSGSQTGFMGAVVHGSEVQIGFTVIAALASVAKILTPFLRD